MANLILRYSLRNVSHQLHHHIKTLSLFMVMLLLLTPINTFSESQQAATTSLPITSSDVKNIISSYRTLLKQFPEYKQEPDKVGNYIQAQNAYTSAEKVIKKYGFKSYQEWSGKLVRISMAYVAYKTKQQQVQLQPEMQKSLDAIKNNPNLSEEQKTSMLNMMGSMDMFSSAMGNISESDLNAIKPHIAELESLFKNQ